MLVMAEKRFTGTPDKAREARQWIDSKLEGCPIAADVTLVVGELVGNAIQHSASGEDGGQFTVRLQAEKVRVEITDEGGPEEPMMRPADVTLDTKEDPESEFTFAESGRGLRLVDAIATQWGVAGNENGRVVWAELTPDEDAGLTNPAESR